ncbi:Cleavage polyadenylation factor subunit clp1 [Pleurotus pulmonarius]|nr:Cleavage polyadenylation factor subunit clp1 [Pleurotus pulmonarius]KAF4608550.1 Cleavage polyadenylation factor subunit clp1 [Pleurotus pulmonarius]
MDSTGAEIEQREWTLSPETEYRFELDPGTTLAIKLGHGQAEVFGAEMVEGKVYLFGSECKAAVYTWRGCTIEMSHPSTEYVSEETPMSAYANLHIALEQMRVRALQTLHGSPSSDDGPGVHPEPPRVLVVGPENCGTTSICKMLVNYAVRAGQNWTPLLANVDPSQGAWAIPGTLSAAPVSAPIATYSPSNPLGAAATSAPMAITSNALLPLVYWYGHGSIGKNPLLFERLIRNLGHVMDDKWDLDAEGAVSGLIVDTPSSFASGHGTTTETRQRLIRACVEAFKINVILVVGHEKLNVELQRAYGSQLTVVKIPKSGGVVELDQSYRERVYNYQLHTYMYGQVLEPPPGVSSATIGGEAPSDFILSPSSTVCKFEDLAIYRIGAETMAPTSALPIGATRAVSEMQPVRIDPSQPGSRLQNAILAVLISPTTDENERYDEEILDLPAMGFLVVTNIDIPGRKMTILSPNQGSVIGKMAVIGTFEWQEQ